MATLSIVPLPSIYTVVCSCISFKCCSCACVLVQLLVQQYHSMVGLIGLILAAGSSADLPSPCLVMVYDSPSLLLVILLLIATSSYSQHACFMAADTGCPPLLPRSSYYVPPTPPLYSASHLATVAI